MKYMQIYKLYPNSQTKIKLSLLQKTITYIKESLQVKTGQVGLDFKTIVSIQKVKYYIKENMK